MKTEAIAPAPQGGGGDGSSESVLLKDGSTAALRPLRREDRHDLRRGFERLSRRSRYFRFHSATGTLTESQLRYLTDVDQRNHLAWCAHTTGGGEPEGVGVARCVRIPGEPKVAEFAVTVVDGFQSLGAGTALLGKLMREARAGGIRTFRCQVLRDNRPMRRILAALPCRYRYESPSLMTAEFDL